MGNCCCPSKPPIPRQETPPVINKPLRNINPLGRSLSPPLDPPASASWKTPWFNRRCFSKKNPLKKIKGFMKQPLLSLEEVLEPLSDQIENLSEMIEIAKKQCNPSSEYNLTHDESAAIYIYTMREERQSVYEQLMAAWNDDDPKKMKPWLKFLRLFRSALDKLPSTTTEIWQAMEFDDALRQLFDEDPLRLYTAIGSCLPSLDDFRDYIQGKKNSPGPICAIGYQSVEGKEIGDYAAKSPKEILIWPGVKVNAVKGNKTLSDGTLTYHLSGPEEMPPPESPNVAATPVPPSPIFTLIPPTPPPAICEPTGPADIVLFDVQKDLPVMQWKPPKVIRLPHFACAKPGCKNHCPGTHDPRHCRGFIYLSHVCSHHCGPGYRCFVCKQHIPKLHQCTECGWRLCQKCAFQ